MSSDCIDFTVVENDDFIGVLNRAYSLRNDEGCYVAEACFEAFSDSGIRCCINGACAVVKNKNFRSFEKRSCDAESLFLTARKIDASLTELGFVAVGE